MVKLFIGLVPGLCWPHSSLKQQRQKLIEFLSRVNERVFSSDSTSQKTYTESKMICPLPECSTKENLMDKNTITQKKDKE